MCFPQTEGYGRNLLGSFEGCSVVTDIALVNQIHGSSFALLEREANVYFKEEREMTDPAPSKHHAAVLFSFLTYESLEILPRCTIS